MTATQSPFLDLLLKELPSVVDQHVTSSATYSLLKEAAKNEVASLFGTPGMKSLGPFGPIAMPYFKMGAIDSLDLFGLDELIIFSFYWKNRHRYKNVLDIGGNIGLHSIILHKCGYKVRVFEPDPTHFTVLNNNLHLNECHGVTSYNAAVSNRSGSASFTRVLGNTTSSHLSGSKQPYGELEEVTVQVQDIGELIAWADLIKMDVEGHEKAILESTTHKQWQGVDAIIEIGSPANAAACFAHLQKIGVNAFSQKRGWSRVKNLDDMPTTHREGSLFITVKEAMPWI